MAANKPPLATGYVDYALDVGAPGSGTELRRGSIPAMREEWRPAKRLAESFWIDWQRPPEEYFELVPSEAFQVERTTAGKEISRGVWEVELEGASAAALTFEFAEQIVGWLAFV